MAEFGPNCIHAWVPSLDDAGNGSATLNDLVGASNGTIDQLDWIPSVDNGGVRALQSDANSLGVNCGDIGINYAQFSVSAWVQFNINSANTVVISAWGGVNVFALMNYSAVNNTPQFLVNLGGNVAARSDVPITDNLWHHWCGRYDGAEVSLWIDGVKQATPAAASGILSGTENTVIGDYSTPGGNWLGLIDSVQLFDTALSPADITTLASSRTATLGPPPASVTYHPLLGRSHPLGGRSHPLAAENIIVPGGGTVQPPAASPQKFGPSMIGCWAPSFDDSGNTTSDLFDLSWQSNDGAITGATWVDDTDSGGVRALSFNGTDDIVTLATPATTNYLFTLSCWFKWNQTSGNLAAIFGDTSSIGFACWLNPSFTGFLTIRFASRTYQISGAAFAANQWYHLAITAEEVTTNNETFTAYVDGVLFGTDTDFIAVRERDYIELIGSSGGVAFDGLIDNVQLYNRALSDGEIARLATSRTYTPALTPVPGQVSWHCPSKDTDGFGTATVTDFVGVNDGEIFNADLGAMWQSDGLVFDGLDDYMQSQIDQPVDLPLTITGFVTPGSVPPEAYPYPFSNSVAVERLNAVRALDGEWYFYSRVSGNNRYASSGIPVEIGKTVALAYDVISSASRVGYVDGGNDTLVGGSVAWETTIDGLYMGCLVPTVSHFNGTVDDLRVFKRSINAAEARFIATSAGIEADSLTGLGDEVAWYIPTLDWGGRGSTILRDQVAGANGTLEGGVTWESDGSLLLDGTGYIDVENPVALSGPTTFAAWVTLDSTATSTPRIMSTGTNLFDLYVASSTGNISLNVNSVDSGIMGILAKDALQHVCVVWTASNVEFFLNGTSQGNFASGATIPASTDMMLGNSPSLSRILKGIMDDIRIYNRALTQAEITHLATGPGIQGPA